MKQSLEMEKVVRLLGLGSFKNLTAIFTGKLGKEELLVILKKVVAPAATILLFIGIWHSSAKALYIMEANFKIEKALNDQGQQAADEMRNCIASGKVGCQPNTLPSPKQVWASYKSLLKDHKIIRADKLAFKEKTAAMNVTRVAEGKNPITYTGRPSFVDQIVTSLKTVISVGLCAMWPTLVNTSMGVSSVDKDYINVAKVLKLGAFQKIFKVILPSSLPLIFTGLRITLSVAWMVLIAIELLAQSPGLFGKNFKTGQ